MDTDSHHTDQNWIARAILGLLVIAGLTLISRYNFLLFHSLAELFSIAVAWAVFMLVWNTRHISDNNAFVWLGIAYLFIGLIDLLHTLAYKGMGVFDPSWGANLPTQLWIAARYMEGIALVLFPTLIKKRISLVPMLGCWTLVTLIFLLTIFYVPLFPDCYVEGAGLTGFKIFSEYLICLLLSLALALLFRKRALLDPSVCRLMVLSVVTTICAELAFTFYVSVYGISNLVGHFFKIVSFYFIYLAMVRSGLTQPFSLLFRSLKARESDLKDAHDHLEQEVRQRTRHLKKALDQLERSNADLAQFVHVASHDLQEPLRAIAGFLQLLESRYRTHLDEKGRNYIDRSVNASLRMQRLITDLLTLSRVNTRGSVFEPTDLNAVVDQVLNRLAPRIQERNVKINRTSLPLVDADADQMGTLFRNLISNAVKYNQSDPPVIDIGWEEKQDKAALYVKDNGIGIDNKFFDRIFVVFQRLHGRQEYSGTGVGLTLCRKIVERHGGAIRVESQKGQGSTFFFTLPKTKEGA